MELLKVYRLIKGKGNIDYNGNINNQLLAVVNVAAKEIKDKAINLIETSTDLESTAMLLDEAIEDLQDVLRTVNGIIESREDIS